MRPKNRRSAAMKPHDATVQSIGRHGYHRIAYRDWGAPSAPTVFCVHGLTRNSRDFDPLARVLAENHRVVCPDLVGRGLSDWLADPTDYHLLQYNLDLTVLAARVGAENFDWIWNLARRPNGHRACWYSEFAHSTSCRQRRRS